MDSLQSSDFCSQQNVTYSHRVYDPDANNWCPVPGGGADALLFAGLAVFSSCALYSKLSAIWVLLAGALFQLLSTAYNLNHFSNALTIWLGMHPSTIFFEIFLPPLLLDSAVRVDFFLFRKVAVNCLIFAFFNVVVSTLAFIPLMLYGLNLGAAGWRAVDAALFGAMLGSTDAVAVTAILKAGGAPEMLSVLLEGESLFNDASSIVLFEIFLHMSLKPGAAGVGKLSDQLWGIVKLIGWLAGTGAIAGLAMGLLTRLLFKLLHRRHASPPVEVAVSLAGAYTVYLCTEYYIAGSGVIAVVVYGLYGASSFLYGFSSKGLRQGAFFKFWDVVSFSVNGMVFFFVGSSIVHFFTSLSSEVFEGDPTAALYLTVKTLPGIIISMFALRWGLITLEAPLLSLVGYGLTWQETLFSALGGLRGGLALILAQTVIARQQQVTEKQLKVVHGEMVIWLSAVVLFTLTVCAPLLGPLMSVLGLNKKTPAQRHMRRRAYSALASFTQQTIEELQADDDEMLRGVDWTAVVTGAVLCSKAAKDLLQSEDPQDQSLKQTGVQTVFKRTPDVEYDTTLNREQSLLLDSLYSTSDKGNRTRGSRESGPRVSSRRPSSEQGGQDASGFRVLTVPLLPGQYKREGGDRYKTHDDGDDSASDRDHLGSDVEHGLSQPQPQGLRTASLLDTTSSEAIFITSRCRAQDQQLAHYVEQASAPFLSGDPHDTPAAAADNQDPTAQHQLASSASEERLAATEGGDVDEYHVDADGVNGEGEDEERAQGVDAADHDHADQVDWHKAHDHLQEVSKPSFRPLNPLIAVRMTAALNMKGRNDVLMTSRSVTDGNSSAQQADTASSQPRGTIGPFVKPSHSFISAAISAAISTRPGAGDSGGNGSTWVKDGTGVHPGPSHGVLMSAALHERGSDTDRMNAFRSGSVTGFRRYSIQTMTSHARWQQQQHIGSGGDDHFNPASVQSLEEGFLSPRTLSDVEVLDEDCTSPEQFLEESRVSLLAGLKRHFRFKAAEGLLSKTSLRVLDYACNACLYKPSQPINLWTMVRHDIKRRGLTKHIAALHFQLRKWQNILLRWSATGNLTARLLKWLLYEPMHDASNYLRRRLGMVALTVLEVALELWLALTASPPARMVRHSKTPASGMLQEELHQQSSAVWEFITERQLEAPDEFASLQTHRVQLAVARRQLAFVEQIAEVGAVEEAASEALLELVEKQLHRFESRGPSWVAPTFTDILRRHSWLANESDDLLLWLRAYGELRSYMPGQCIIPRKRSAPPGIFIVLNGLVKVETMTGTLVKTHYVGVGGCFGFISSVLGREANGIALLTAYAQGDSLCRGPMALHLPMRLLATIKQRAAPAMRMTSLQDWQQQQQQPGQLDPQNAAAAAAAADSGSLALSPAAFAQLLLNMHRHVGIMMVDKMGEGLLLLLAAHIETAVQAVVDYSSKLPAVKAHAKLLRLLEALLRSSGRATSDIAATVAAGTTAAAAAGSTYAGSADGRSDVNGEAAMKLVMDRAAAAAASLRNSLRSADLVTVSPGDKFTLSSITVLLKGSLRAQHSSSEPASAVVALGHCAVSHPNTTSSYVNKQYHAPAVMIWAPELFDGFEDRYDQRPRKYIAGAQGALLLVSHGSSDDSSSIVSDEREEHTAATTGAAAAAASSSSLQQQEGAAHSWGYIRSAAHKTPAAATAPRLDPRQRMSHQRLSSVVPLQKTNVSAVGPEQDAV